MEAKRYQDLSSFGGTARGRAAWRAQIWWLFETLFVRPTPQYMFGWRRLALILFGAKIGKRTHDYRDSSFRFVSAPIRIAGECWIAARAFIGPGVEIGHASVIGAGSIVTENVDAATIVAGNPAKLVGRRTTETAAGVPK